MLSEEEKKEMLTDANDKSRRDSFRFSKKSNVQSISFDEYLNFLNDVQQIFFPFKGLKNITQTRLNKL